MDEGVFKPVSEREIDCLIIDSVYDLEDPCKWICRDEGHHILNRLIAVVLPLLNKMNMRRT